MADSERVQHMSETPEDSLSCPKPCPPESAPSEMIMSDQHRSKEIETREETPHNKQASPPPSSKLESTRLTGEPLEKLNQPIEEHPPRQNYGLNSDGESYTTSIADTERSARPPLPFRLPKICFDHFSNESGPTQNISKPTNQLNDQEKCLKNEYVTPNQPAILHKSTETSQNLHLNDKNMGNVRADYDKKNTDNLDQSQDISVIENASLPLEAPCNPNSISQPEHEYSRSDDRKQRKEKYDIKLIKWCDQDSIRNTRISPILIQNANGPCPLLALVNALTLSTPAGLNTPLVDTLKSREQISLGLLLDAVFDELTSERRSSTTNELPDVTDLYSFLVTLHTGMNVNPCFFPQGGGSVNEQSMSPEEISGEREVIPGSFEETREMRLYSTFKIPLIHGWLPHPQSLEYGALFRSAKTYEDAQNKMLMQDTLEAKLREGVLDLKEQSLLEDITTIKYFITSNATQLTSQGLDTITRSIPPGTVAIFFRNNHFSTLYRHIENYQLFQLVTDIGYAKNDDVIWESLIDVNGENAQFFSGNFRLVSGNSNTQASTPKNNSCELDSHVNLKSPAFDSSIDIESTSLQNQNMVQEDQDLALALQIQEEEEQSHRAARYRRRLAANRSQQHDTQAGQNDSEVSQSLTSNRTSVTSRIIPENRPAIPPRKSIMNVGGQPRSRIADVDVVADLPPSYEVAATQQAYLPLNSQSNFDATSNRVNDSEIGLTEHENIRNSKPSQGIDRRRRQSEQTGSPRTGLRRDKRLASVQGVMDKVVSGQERVQKECAIM
ncbi:Ubiquitin carboxyl-terminal hydrolase MINDY-1 [Golovinomyces cichoracearum]|uniref:Ubiquitin carboxyl-terminal hydrolase MINDY-1 n=1 Tax=Golovinomyces cichoracearum TaxID=62708 RepID=A0A420J1H3_9PEZI|nr:Ubiquitin carboxyl-terminal hydrolase MINDY-1 [Golovinomyces cichoracearum]